MTLDMNALPLPKVGEIWTDGRGRRVRIYSCYPGRDIYPATVGYKGVTTLFKRTNSQVVRLDDFRKRFQPEPAE